MDLNLNGRTALVTGSTAGIGFSVAEGLAGLGARTIVNGRTRARVDDAIARLRERVPSGRFEAAPFDLATAEGCAGVAAAFPDVDVLVNNVGIFEPVPFEQIEDARWLHFFEVNVLSGVRLARAYLPGMRERAWGRIVFVSSESGLQIPVEMIHYGMTKTAQLAIARGLAESVAGTGITVNAALPGPTRSEGVGAFVAQMAAARGVDETTLEREFFRTARPSSLLQRFLTTDEVANAIVYLCTPAASGTTGTAVRVDGGVVRSIA